MNKSTTKPIKTIHSIEVYEKLREAHNIIEDIPKMIGAYESMLIETLIGTMYMVENHFAKDMPALGVDK